jgi:hypothetical protein
MHRDSSGSRASGHTLWVSSFVVVDETSKKVPLVLSSKNLFALNVLIIGTTATSCSCAWPFFFFRFEYACIVVACQLPTHMCRYISKCDCNTYMSSPAATVTSEGSNTGGGHTDDSPVVAASSPSITCTPT